MSEKLLKIGDVAELIGFSVQGVYQLVYRKKIPVLKISRKAVRFRESDIEAWLQAKFQASTPDSQHPKPTDPKPTPNRKRGRGKNNYVDRLVEEAKKEV